MCTINCSGGCPECAPDEHRVTVCDWCGIYTFEVDTEETGSFGYSGRMCRTGVGCQRYRASNGRDLLLPTSNVNMKPSVEDRKV